MVKPLHQLLVGSALIIATSAFAQSAPEFVWGNLLTGKPGQDQNSGIAVSGDNSVYWLSTNGSTTDDTDVTYAGNFLYDGSAYDGTSANRNLTLLKTNAGGAEQWVVYSKAGDFISGEGKVAVNSNGDIVVFGSVRHTDGYYGNGICLVDASGKETELSWEVGEKTNNRLFLATVTSEGNIRWAKTFEISTAPAAAADGSNSDFTTNAVNAYALAVDGDNNIYIGGRYRNSLTFNKADGSDVTLKPKNVSTWDGDSQKACGDMYVVKLDSDGNYLTHLEESGDEVEISYVWDLRYANGSLFMAAYAKSDGEASMTVGGVSLTPNQYISPIVGRLNGDLDVEWMHLLPGGDVAGKNAVQNVSISVSENNVWLTGAYNGRISDGADDTKFVESTQGNLREGFIIKLDAKDGNWLAAADSRSDFSQNFLTAYLRVITEDETGSDNILVYGYALNATVGAFIRTYNAETLSADTDQAWNIVTQGGAPTAQDIAYMSDLRAAFVTVRGNKAFQPLGGELSEGVTGFTNYLARFDLPESTSGVDSILDVAPADNEGEVIYFDLQGRQVKNPSASGVYVRKQGDKVSKIMVR